MVFGNARKDKNSKQLYCFIDVHFSYMGCLEHWLHGMALNHPENWLKRHIFIGRQNICIGRQNVIDRFESIPGFESTALQGWFNQSQYVGCFTYTSLLIDDEKFYMVV